MPKEFGLFSSAEPQDVELINVVAAPDSPVLTDGYDNDAKLQELVPELLDNKRKIIAETKKNQRTILQLYKNNDNNIDTLTTISLLLLLIPEVAISELNNIQNALISFEASYKDKEKEVPDYLQRLLALFKPLQPLFNYGDTLSHKIRETPSLGRKPIDIIIAITQLISDINNILNLPAQRLQAF